MVFLTLRAWGWQEGSSQEEAKEASFEAGGDEG